MRFEQEEPFVRALAQDPQDGDEPLDIVKGFLSASASVDEQVARKFLAPEARGLAAAHARSRCTTTSVREHPGRTR